jgi:hypothetical protein
MPRYTQPPIKNQADLLYAMEQLKGQVSQPGKRTG